MFQSSKSTIHKLWIEIINSGVQKSEATLVRIRIQKASFRVDGVKVKSESNCLQSPSAEKQQARLI